MLNTIFEYFAPESMAFLNIKAKLLCVCIIYLFVCLLIMIFHKIRVPPRTILQTGA